MIRLRWPVLTAALILATLAILLMRAAPGPAARAAPAAAAVSRVAYIYDSALAVRDEYKNLLESRGYTVDLVPLASVATADFSADQVIIAGPDTGNFGNWGTDDAVANVSAANRFIVGLGEGGASLFSRLGLFINWGQSGYDSYDSTLVVDPADPIWSTPNLIPIGQVAPLVQVYSTTVSVLHVFNPTVVPGVVRIGRSPNAQTASYYPLITQGAQGRCYLLWGWMGMPALLTRAGQDLFQNLVESRPCDRLFAATATPTPTNTPTSTPTPLSGPCQEIFAPKDIPAPGLIHFDDLPNAATIGDAYAAAHGIHFEISATNRAIIYANEPDKAHSRPNVAINDAVFPNTSNNIPLRIDFDTAKTHVGFYMGNGETQQISAVMTAYDAQGQLLCRVANMVPEPLTEFIGIYDPAGRIRRVLLDYGNTALSEAIDDLYFAPGGPGPRTPVPTVPPTATATPTRGPTPTPTPPLYALPYAPPLAIAPIILPSVDLSIWGIEITQGIQCFNTAQGLASCANNSLPVVTQKSAVARIYLKHSGAGSSTSNVPVRLYIRANNVWYNATVNGKAKNTLGQGNADDSANVWFYVDFTNDVTVDFYAQVDPNGTFLETDEGNNRYPALGYITLNFKKRKTLDITGRRLHYHPSGYGGTQDAAGWAVNGGAALWLNRVMPIRNGGIDYSVASGTLDWTISLDIPGQHALIQYLNTVWILQNAFSWLFGTGAFTGAEHVYGWTPNAGLSGGHADMPVYPHAGGLGIVAIGTDNPGVSVDNPGSGALIFGHELVHDYDIKHTNTADSCGSSDGSTDFPYASSSIQEYGFNPDTGQIYKPSETHDLMSYCPGNGSKKGWISPFTWNKLFNHTRLSSLAFVKTADLSRAERGQFVQTDGTQSLAVQVTISNTVPAAGRLGTLHQMPGGLAYTIAAGPYAIQLKSGADILWTTNFSASFTSEHPHEPEFPTADLSFIMPSVPTATQVVLLKDFDVLDVRNISQNPPGVSFTYPLTPQTWLSGTSQTLAWTGSDPDGDALTYSLLYSNDAGTTWQVMASGLTGTAYEVAVNSLAGGIDVRFRVVASDGFHMSYAETPATIAVPNKPPLVVILNPLDGQLVPYGSLLVMHGDAVDLEDGTLAGGALVWSSDRQGPLGIGATLPVGLLVPGPHIITLSASDSLGAGASAQVSIFVHQAPLYLPVIIR